jgi:hypothetical protein
MAEPDLRRCRQHKTADDVRSARTQFTVGEVRQAQFDLVRYEFDLLANFMAPLSDDAVVSLVIREDPPTAEQLPTEGGPLMAYLNELTECPWCHGQMPEGFATHECPVGDQPYVGWPFAPGEVIQDDPDTRWWSDDRPPLPSEAWEDPTSGRHAWQYLLVGIVAVAAIFGLYRLLR